MPQLLFISPYLFQCAFIYIIYFNCYDNPVWKNRIFLSDFIEEDKSSEKQVFAAVCRLRSPCASLCSPCYMYASRGCDRGDTVCVCVSGFFHIYQESIEHRFQKWALEKKSRSPSCKLHSIKKWDTPDNYPTNDKGTTQWYHHQELSYQRQRDTSRKTQVFVPSLIKLFLVLPTQGRLGEPHLSACSPCSLPALNFFPLSKMRWF